MIPSDPACMAPSSKLPFMDLTRHGTAEFVQKDFAPAGGSAFLPLDGALTGLDGWLSEELRTTGECAAATALEALEVARPN